MERFKKTELLDIIEKLTKENNARPCIKEILVEVNKNIHPEDYDNYETYFEQVLNEPVLRYYIKIYGFRDLLSRKTDKVKTPDYDKIQSIRESLDKK